MDGRAYQASSGHGVLVIAGIAFGLGVGLPALMLVSTMGATWKPEHTMAVIMLAGVFFTTAAAVFGMLLWNTTLNRQRAHLVETERHVQTLPLQLQRDRYALELAQQATTRALVQTVGQFERNGYGGGGGGSFMLEDDGGSGE